MNKIYDLSLKHPSRFIIYGPSGSGKTTFVEKLLSYMKELFGFYFNKIVYFSGQSFCSFDKVHRIPIIKIDKFTNDDLLMFNSSEKNLLIIDDNMHNVANDLLISELFTKFSHHKNISVILLVQNLFPKSKYMRDLSSNTTYIVLMSNPRETLQIRTLSSQIDGDNSQFIMKCFQQATKNKPYSYLFLDFDQNTPEEVRVRTNIFPNEETFAYVKVS